MIKDEVYQYRLKLLQEREEFKASLLKKNLGKLENCPSDKHIIDHLGERKSNEQIMQEAKEFSVNKINQQHFQHKKNLEQNKKLTKEQKTMKLSKQFSEKMRSDRERDDKDRER